MRILTDVKGGVSAHYAMPLMPRQKNNCYPKWREDMETEPEGCGGALERWGKGARTYQATEHVWGGASDGNEKLKDRPAPLKAT